MPTFDETATQVGQETGDSSWAEPSFIRIGQEGSGQQHLGFRVASYDPANGSTHSTAQAVVGIPDVNSSAAPAFVASAEDTDDAAALGSSRRPSQLTLTTASVSYDAGDFTAGNDRLIDFVDALDEVVARGGWSADNAFVGVMISVGGVWQDITIVNGVTWMSGTPNPMEFESEWTEGATEITMTAESGSYSVTGGTVGLLADRVLVPEADAYDVTGGAVSLLADRVLGIEPDSYDWTGSDVEFARDYILGVGTDSYTITGATVSLEHHRILTAEADSYDVTGGAVTLLRDSLIDVEPDSYDVTGGDVDLLATRTLGIEAGSYTYTGADVTLQVAITLEVEPGSYSVGGQAVTLSRDAILAVEAGSYTYTGSDVTLDYSAGYTLDVEAGGYVIAGATVDLLADRILGVEADSYTFTGADVDLLRSYPLTVESGSIVITGADVDFARDYVLGVAAGSYTYSGADVTLTYDAGDTPVHRQRRPVLHWTIENGRWVQRRGFDPSSRSDLARLKGRGIR